MNLLRFQIWKNKDGTEWTCAQEGNCYPYDFNGVPVDVDDIPMKLMWEFDVDVDDFDGNVDHARRAAGVAAYTYHAGHFRWPVEQKLNSKKRAAEKQASRDEDARRLAAGEVSREQLSKENGSFSFPNVEFDLSRAKKKL